MKNAHLTYFEKLLSSQNTSPANELAERFLCFTFFAHAITFVVTNGICLTPHWLA